jgi:hypothetical protein
MIKRIKLSELRKLIKEEVNLSEGMVGIKHWQESDETADFMADIQEFVIRKLRTQVKKRGNEFNTTGAWDVCLVAKTGILEALDMVEQVGDIYEKAAEQIEKDLKDPGFDWNDSQTISKKDLQVLLAIARKYS